MLPNLQLLEKISSRIQNIPNQQGEYLRKIHVGCFLLGFNSGLRVSEAISFDLNAKTRKGLYRLTKTKGQKERYVYVPKAIINELKKHN
jgi:site-specific recombinase XerD